MSHPKLADLYEFIIKVVDQRISEIKATREDFSRVEEALKRLTEAQHKTEEKLAELIEAQRKTEKRVAGLKEHTARLEKAMAELAEAQQRTEMRVARLEEHTARLEKAIANLAEAQRKTEERVEELAKAQIETEEALASLARVVREQNVKIDRLSNVIGFGLEDIARVVLPGWLYRHLSVEVENFRREFFEIDQRRVEVNLYGEGRVRGEAVVVVAECKSRIHERDVDKFFENVYEPVSKIKDVKVVGVLFGFLIYPEAREKAKKLGIHVVASYER